MLERSGRSSLINEPTVLFHSRMSDLRNPLLTPKLFYSFMSSGRNPLMNLDLVYLFELARELVDESSLISLPKLGILLMLPVIFHICVSSGAC